MSRVIIHFNDNENFINIEAEEFHEDEGFLKAYTTGHQLVAMVDVKFVKCAYQTEERQR